MKIKIDEHLKKIAGNIIVFPDPSLLEIIANEISKRILDSRLIEDTADNYGMTILDIVGHQNVSKIYDVLSAYIGKNWMTSVVIDSINNLTIMGDGDCPECGGEMEFVEEVGKWRTWNGPDGRLEREWESDGYKYICRECGNTIILDEQI